MQTEVGLIVICFFCEPSIPITPESRFLIRVTTCWDLRNGPIVSNQLYDVRTMKMYEFDPPAALVQRINNAGETINDYAEGATYKEIYSISDLPSSIVLEQC